MVERKVPAYNRLKTDCVALRSVWLRTRMAGGVGAGGVNAPRYPIRLDYLVVISILFAGIQFVFQYELIQLLNILVSVIFQNNSNKLA